MHGIVNIYMLRLHILMHTLCGNVFKSHGDIISLLYENKIIKNLSDSKRTKALKLKENT